VADVAEAAPRWCAQFGLVERDRDERSARLACDDEPFCLELVASEERGVEHVAYELRRHVTLDDARSHFDAADVPWEDRAEGLRVLDPEGNGVLVVAHREPASRWTPHARPASGQVVGHPRKLGHVNFLTGRIDEQVEFYVGVLGMGLTDFLGDAGVWLHVNADHHVMALVNAVPPARAHFHHLAFDVVDIGQMRVALDHLGRHGRWLGWGPTRHGVGGNIASYVRIVEEECFVELYCDMEQLEPDHEPRRWPDDRFSSNTWGPLPPRSYFRFDAAAVASERESLEMLGTPLGEEARA
jgi:catechol 2,3-dioxygenase-like lactoylglutathione lyase family enzyme